MISDNMVWRSLIGLEGLLYLCIRSNYLQWEVAFLKVSESHEMSEEQVLISYAYQLFVKELGN